MTVWKMGLLAVMLAGCAGPAVNPSFPVTATGARKSLQEIDCHPGKLKRPVVVIGGFREMGIPAAGLTQAIADAFPGRMVLGVRMSGCATFDACADKVLAAVSARFPSRKERTVEVDVVGISMGGLVARYAALPHEGRPQLWIHRLYTISTPHRGARLAVLPTFSELQRGMRAQSGFMKHLNAAPRDYAIVPYVRLGDQEVGPMNAAPQGQMAWWVPYGNIFTAHNLAYSDPRIRLDIILRLRGDKPITRPPPAPLPGK